MTVEGSLKGSEFRQNNHRRAKVLANGEIGNLLSSQTKGPITRLTDHCKLLPNCPSFGSDRQSILYKPGLMMAKGLES